MKVQTIKTFKNLDGICKEGDILTLEMQRYEEDHTVHDILYARPWGRGIHLSQSKELIPPDKLPTDAWKFSDANIIPKGSIKSWVAITEDGRRYPESTFIGAIGYQPLSKIFKKL